MSRGYRAPSGPRGYHNGPGPGSRGYRAASGGAPRGGREEESSDSVLDAATTAAESFVRDYYDACNTHRHAVASYYLPTAGVAGAETVAPIVFNGVEQADGKAVQELFQKTLPRSHIEVDSVDCHILNATYPTKAPNAQRSPNASVSILITVGGIFKAVDGRDAEEDDFNDSFVIVPNPEPPQPRGRHKPYLIETQNFRLVSGEPPLNTNSTMMT